MLDKVLLESQEEQNELLLQMDEIQDEIRHVMNRQNIVIKEITNLDFVVPDTSSAPASRPTIAPNSSQGQEVPHIAISNDEVEGESRFILFLVY